MTIKKIAIDSMGGDFGPEVTVPAAAKALDQYSDIELVLVGQETQLIEQLRVHGLENENRLSIHPATQVVGMDEMPAIALKKKKDSSMRVAINLVKEGSVGACISAGNTGALMATSKFVLKTIPGIHRPAICTSLPTVRGHTHMLDLGANIDCTAEHLLQFAVMGSVLAQSVDDNSQPSIGLLNIGSEAIKGNEVVKEASQLIGHTSLNYAGFIEGDDIYTGKVDVVVSDGFVGNVSLKTAEGLASLVKTVLKTEFKKNIFTRLAALIALPIIKAVQHTLDPRQYNGASLLGLNGIVIKSHGSADVDSFFNAIKIASIEIDKSVPERISKEIELYLQQHEEKIA
ncbi:MAG: phosphate acyltransferase PlsX [Gammaproteobacteria bacterium]|nr:phosphate acyltransferase PlsX [Gammaproteobacteria bacterium]